MSLLRSSIPFAPGFLSRIHLPIDRALYGHYSSIEELFEQQHQQEQHSLIDYISSELEIGSKPLSKWRETVMKHNNINNIDETISSSSSVSPLDSLIHSCKQDLNITLSPCVTLFRSSNNKGIGIKTCAKRMRKGQTLPAGFYLMSVPVSSIMRINDYHQDRNNNVQQENDDENEDSSMMMFDEFFDSVEKLSVPLFEALIQDTKTNKFHRWVKFLYEEHRHERNINNNKNTMTIGRKPPVMNLPYLAPTLFQTNNSNKSHSNTSLSLLSPKSNLGKSLVLEYEARVQELLRNQEEEQEVDPIGKKKVLEALRGVPEHYLRWAASTVLSRRIAGNMLVPLLDFANHTSDRCNSFYSIPSNVIGASSPATPNDDPSKQNFDDDDFSTLFKIPQQDQKSIENFLLMNNNNISSGKPKSLLSGLDFIDNLFSGVRDDLLFEPHLHHFAIAPIRGNEEITLCYSDVDPNNEVFEDRQPENNEEQEESQKYENRGSLYKQSTLQGRIERYKKQKESVVDRMLKKDYSSYNNKNDERVVVDDDEKILVDCGRDTWLLQYGFDPKFKTDTPSDALNSISKMIARNRILKRQDMFPQK